MLKKRLFCLSMVLVLVLASTAVSFAADDKGINITESGKTLVIDDQIIKDMIEGIDDPVKKEKIREYWLTPAWWSTTAKLDEQANDLNIKKAADKIQGLIETPTSELDGAIEKLLEKDSAQLAQKNVNIFPEYMGYLEKHSVKNADLLNAKVAACESILNHEEKAIAATRNTIITKTTSGTYSQGNSSSVYYLYLRAYLSWSYDQYTTYITALDYTHTTRCGSYYVISGLIKNEEKKMNSGVPGYGLIHKSNYVGSLTAWGYFVVDIKVQESQVIKKYVNFIPDAFYSGYNWSN